MDHAPGSDTFQKHYLNRNVNADLWAIHRSLQPQTALINQIVSHGGSRNTRRPIKLTKEQLASCKSEGLYVQLTQRLAQLKKGTVEYDTVRKRRKQVLAKARNKKLASVRAEWNDSQAVTDIERQLNGQPFEPYSGRSSRPMSAAQRRMFEALQAPLVNDLTAQANRRTKAINAIVAYCNVEEPLTTVVLDACRPPAPPEVTGKLEPIDRARKFRASVIGPVREVGRHAFSPSFRARSIQ